MLSLLTILLSSNAMVGYAAPFSSAAITISPTSGPPGTEVTVRGSNYALVSTISIRFDGTSVDTSPETVYVKLDGTFVAEFVVPDAITGNPGEEKTVVASDSYGNSASADFQLTDDSGGSSSQEQYSAARSQSITIDEDTSTLVRLRASHHSEDTRFIIVDDPSHGALSKFDSELGTLQYSPEENYFGTDKFTFRVQGGNALGTISIMIEGKNDSPTAKSQQIETVEESSKQITLLGSDIENDNSITFSIVGNPAHGRLTGTVPNVTYLPDKDYSGFDSFRFRTNDGEANSDIATVSIVVSGVNDPPVVDGIANVFIKRNDDVRITLVAFDVDSKSVFFSITSGPEHGNLTKPVTTAPLVAIATYTPDPEYFGTDAFTFMVNDGSTEYGISNTGKVGISVGIVSNSNVEPAADSDGTVQSSAEFPSSFAEGTPIDNEGHTSDENRVLQGTTTLLDVVPPRLNIPTSPVQVEATSQDGAIVIYATAAVDDVDGIIPPLCSPASGSVFPAGNITVRCSATDNVGNGVEKTFMVSVKPMEADNYPQILDSVYVIPTAVIGAVAIAVIILIKRLRAKSLQEKSFSPVPDHSALP